MTVEFLQGHYPYVLVIVLLLIGLYGMTLKGNLLKKLIGMTIFQTSIYLFFIQGAVKTNATIPVFSPELGPGAENYMNPLPQVIVLTAIVVGVAITGVALSLLLVTQQRYGTIEEDEILEQMRQAE